MRIEISLRTIHTAYFNIIRRIQKLSKFKPKTAEKLMKKYSGRRKRKAVDGRRKIARKIVDLAGEHGVGIVMKGLKEWEADKLWGEAEPQATLMKLRKASILH